MQTQSSNTQPDLSHLFAEGLLCESNPPNPDPNPADPPDHGGGNKTTPGSGSTTSTTTPTDPPDPDEVDE